MQNSKEKIYEQDLTRGSVPRLLIWFSVPFMLSSLVLALYNTADLYIVSRFCPTYDISGVNIAKQVQNVVFNLVGGFTVGGSVLVAQFKGAGREKDVRQTIGSLISLLGIVSAAITVITISLARPILLLVNTPEDSMPSAMMYFIVCVCGMPFITAFNCFSSIMRGIGDSKRPLIFTAIGCAANILLDLIFVGGLRMGVAGAALAMVLSHFLSVALAVASLTRSGFDFNFRENKSYRIRSDKLRGLISQGGPVALQGAIVSASFLIMTAVINNVGGDDASAAVGIFSSYNSLAILPALAIGQAVAAMSGQNIGAGKPKRALRTMWTGVWIASFCCIALFCVFMIFPENLMRVFSDDPDVIAYGVTYFRWGNPDLLFVPIAFCVTNFIAGAGHPMINMVSSIGSSVLLRAPLAILLGITLGTGLAGVAAAVPISTLASNIIVLIYVFSGKWKKSAIREYHASKSHGDD